MYNKNYYNSHKFKIAVSSKKYYEANKERIKAKVKAYRQLNKDTIKIKRKLFDKVNKERIKDRHLKKQFGISLQQKRDMIKTQDNKCAICKEPETAFDSRLKVYRELSVDHCHKTGKVRGLLCSNCNTAIGLFYDSPDICIKASNYLLTNK